MVWASYYRYIAAFGAEISIDEFARIYMARDAGKAVSIPRAMDEPFYRPRTATEFQILSCINRFRARRVDELQADIAVQQSRLALAQASFARKPTKKAQESLRIAPRKIAKSESDLADLDRKQPLAGDNRIFPKYYAPVMVSVAGRRTVLPMRYLIRPSGYPESFDRTHDGAYNARRDNLQKFWRNQFTHTHGVVLLQRFYEWVDRTDEAGRPFKTELEFDPRGMEDMVAACIWARWTGADGTELHSFALITDEPPAEIAAAGHDRCIVPIRTENLDAWLNPEPGDYAAMQAILDARERPFYEHRIAA